MRTIHNHRHALAGLFTTLLAHTAISQEITVITDSAHPVSTTANARIIVLDLATRIENELAANLTSDAAASARLVEQRLRDGGQALHARIGQAYQGVVDAWSLGVTTLPAVVVDRRYVVYGESNVARAVARIDAYRRAPR